MLQHFIVPCIFIMLISGVSIFAPQRISIIELFKPTLDCLTPIPVAPRLMWSDVKRR